MNEQHENFAFWPNWNWSILAVANDHTTTTTAQLRNNTALDGLQISSGSAAGSLLQSGRDKNQPAHVQQ